MVLSQYQLGIWIKTWLQGHIFSCVTWCRNIRQKEIQGLVILVLVHIET